MDHVKFPHVLRGWRRSIVWPLSFFLVPPNARSPRSCENALVRNMIACLKNGRPRFGRAEWFFSQNFVLSAADKFFKFFFSFILAAQNDF